MNNKFFILREFAENQTIDKEKICFTYNISYSEFDNYVNELLNVDKYLIPNDDASNNWPYKLSDDGIHYLNQYKVNKAVILASGLGTRMGELTKNTSKCLLSVHNEVLVERLISQFKERGINDIIVVVGYFKEKFAYLKDKFNVKLIENPEYNTKNTIATFHCVINEIKNSNTYITVGDIYLSENLFHTYEVEPFYTGVWTDDCTNEWTYIYDENNKVYGVNVDGKYDYCMAGFSFHTKEFISKLCEFVEIDYNRPGTEKYYWEEVLLNNISKLPDFFVHKFSSVAIQEFDTIKDLYKLNDELIALKDQIKTIFNTNSDNLIFTKTNDGLTNNTYVLEMEGKKYIVRVPGMSTNLLIDRKNEKRNYDELKKYNLTDNLIFFDEDSGLKITEYFENALTANINDEKDLINCMALYKKLHSLNIDTNHDINIANIFKFYLSILEKHKLKFIYGDFKSTINKCNEIIDFINKLNRPNTFTHGDAGYCNVLKTNFGYKLIDFEFAGMADPITDIALFGFCSNMDIDSTLKLLDIYINCKVQDVDNDSFLKKFKINDNYEEIKALVVAYIAIDSVTCAIWNQIRITITNKHSYSYSENCLKLLDAYYKYLKDKNFL